ncbi:SANT/Myb domain-containing protein [Bradyrhizobium canariense]|uniref:Myb-like DNA-binding domain-containing protein n=1 Tax=Bradyrhizobium canariense TaxID=255045 RepID=UPI001CA4F192|nr:Myb-like DNA-binding domain-containing protein [Bradyrhizobium canariense]MBW5438358.1 SANT/Myb domain-containing protein [Bradyrhizobium canariense]
MAQSRLPLVRRWTPEEHQQLLAMAAAGRRPAEIARALGRTEPAVRGRANLHNILLRLVTQRRKSPGSRASL